MIALNKIIQELKPSKVIGNSSVEVDSVIQLDIQSPEPFNIAWINEKNKEKAYSITQGVIICPSSVYIEKLSSTATFLLFDNPRLAFQNLLLKFFVPGKPSPVISPSAIIDKSATIGTGVYIGNNTVIEKDVQIGDNVTIYHNNSILSGTIIKDNVQIGSNNTIGGIGFGYEKDESGSYVIMPHIGNVVIEENVEIGNNTCIDRAVLGSTLLSKNCKVDNLVHIAHGVVIGENSLIIAHAMIGGSTKIGKNVWVAPNTSVINKVTVGDDATIGLGAVVIKNVNDREIVVGNPAKPLVKK